VKDRLCLDRGVCGEPDEPHDVHVWYASGGFILETWWAAGGRERHRARLAARPVDNSRLIPSGAGKMEAVASCVP
jgi:hypothetical protein